MLPPNPPCTVTTAGACGEDCVALVDFGCVHEHIEPAVPVCARHLDRAGSVGFYCQKCWDAHHACPMLASNVQLLPK